MSVDISRGQYLLLKKFRKDNISAESLDKKQLDDCDYLVKCGFLKAIKEFSTITKRKYIVPHFLSTCIGVIFILFFTYF